VSTGARTARLLIRLPNWLGDVVSCLPLVEQAASVLDNLTLVAPQAWHELLERVAPQARFLVPSRKLIDSTWRGHTQALLLDGSLRSASQAWFAGIPVRVGLGDGGRWVLLNGGVRAARESGAAPLSQIRRLSGSRRAPRPFGSTAAELLALLPGRPAGLVQNPRPRLDPG
jgi:ADP-heptose:LPS heptosyltransferase